VSLAVSAPGLPGLPAVVVTRTRRAWVPLLVACLALVWALSAATVCTFPREDGILEVVTWPSGAEVEVDGIALGRAPLRLELAPGAHEVVLTPEGGCPVRQDVTVSSGAITVLEHAASVFY
jgi:hypothetical protein